MRKIDKNRQKIPSKLNSSSISGRMRGYTSQKLILYFGVYEGVHKSKSTKTSKTKPPPPFLGQNEKLTKTDSFLGQNEKNRQKIDKKPTKLNQFSILGRMRGY